MSVSDGAEAPSSDRTPNRNGRAGAARRPDNGNGRHGHAGNGSRGGGDEEKEVQDVNVMVPGRHHLSGGHRPEVSEQTFADDVLDALPADLLYRSSGVVGVLAGSAGCREFDPVDATDVRLFMASPWAKQSDPGAAKVRVRLIENVRTETGNLLSVPVKRSEDHGRLVLKRARRSERVRQLVRIVQYPVYDRSLNPLPPGWSPDGTYYDAPEAISGIQPESDQSVIQDVLDDLVVDFPFKDDASRHNFFGLMLTPILRPALDGNVPLHLVLASLERTGKSKLLEEVLGGIILGRPTPSLTFSDDKAELKKEIVSLLVEGDTLIHFDNLGSYIDSPILASLLTSTYIKGRLLGLNKVPRLLNTLIVTASGNNVRATGEVVKRTIPIRLQPKDDHPEDRCDFVHPNLRSHVASVRPAVLSCLIGMVERWKRSGCPPGNRRMGGFEDWARIVGGVAAVNGFDKWMTNVDEWRKLADPDGEDLRAFVTEWARNHGRNGITTSDLLRLAQRYQLFPAVLRKASAAAALSSFSKGVLARNLDRPVIGLVIERNSSGNNTAYHLSGDDAAFNAACQAPEREAVFVPEQQEEEVLYP